MTHLDHSVTTESWRRYDLSVCQEMAVRSIVQSNLSSLAKDRAECASCRHIIDCPVGKGLNGRRTRREALAWHEE